MVTVSSARRFLEAFSAAVHDVKLENVGYEIYHHFDSDFLIRMIFGYRDTINRALIERTKHSRSGGDPAQRLLMGALISQRVGAPPLMRALLPHLYQVRRSVEGPRAHDSSDVHLVMQELGIQDSLEELHAALADGMRTDELLRLFVEQGPQIFYGAELLSEVWQWRLTQVLGLGIQDPGPFDDDTDIVGSEAFRVLAGEVVQMTDTRNGGVNGLRDAMALATLARAVGAHGEQKRVARFYTETPRILDAWARSAEVRALLTYDMREPELATGEYGENSVLRTVDYYLIRALIPELAYDGTAVPGGASKHGGIYKIADDLTEAAKELQQSGISEDRLTSVRIGAQTLGDYMAQVTDLSYYGSVWRSLGDRLPPRLPRTLSRPLEEVLADRGPQAEALEKSFRKQVRDLSKRTRDVEAFTDDYTHLTGVLDRWDSTLKPRYGTLTEHVGLTRWGLEPNANGEVELALARLIENFDEWRDARDHGPHETSIGRTGFVIGIAQQLRDMGTAPATGPDHLAECVALLGFLWLLDDFRSVFTHGEQFLRGIRKTAPLTLAAQPHILHDRRYSLYGRVAESLCAAAVIADAVTHVKQFPPLGAPAEKLLSRMRAVIEQTDDSRRQFPANPEEQAILHGWILFRVWRAFSPELAKSESGEAAAVARKLAKESLALCLAALQTCDHQSFMYALLLNHCVYMAAVTRLIDPTSELLFQELIQLRYARRDALSYRVDDTIAYFYYVRARNTWELSARSCHTTPRLRELAEDDLKNAKIWLKKIPRVSNSVIDEHRFAINELWRTISLGAAPV